VGGGPGSLQPGTLGKLTCRDWNGANLDGKTAIIEDIRLFAGGEVTGTGVQGRGPVLDDERAYELFEGRCKDPVADNFLLYKLYTHAAAFAGGAP
jgi:hypothetical protein